MPWTRASAFEKDDFATRAIVELSRKRQASMTSDTGDEQSLLSEIKYLGHTINWYEYAMDTVTVGTLLVRDSDL